MKRAVVSVTLLALLLGTGWFLLRSGEGTKARSHQPGLEIVDEQGPSTVPQLPPASRKRGATPSSPQGDTPDLAAAILSPKQVKVAGQVRNSQTDQPQAAVDVVFANALGESTATSDSNGDYEMLVVPGMYKLRAQGERVASLEASLLVLTDMRHDVLVLEFATIEGIALLPNGDPAKGVLVLSVGENRAGKSLELGQTETGEDGTFLLQTHEGASRLVATSAKHAGQTKVSALGAGDSQQGVTIKMLPNGTVSGTVVDAHGVSIANANVLISVEYIGQGRYDRRPHLSDERGEFAWLLPQFGNVIVEANATDFSGSVPLQFDLRPGESRKKLRIVLGEAEFSLVGRVVDDEGKVLAGVEVAQGAEGSKSRYRKTRSDERGNFAFEKLSKGPHRLRARLSGYKQTRVGGLVAPNDRIQIVMPRD
jgi:hypothetical protein